MRGRRQLEEDELTRAEIQERNYTDWDAQEYRNPFESRTDVARRHRETLDQSEREDADRRRYNAREDVRRRHDQEHQPRWRRSVRDSGGAYHNDGPPGQQVLQR